MDLLFKITTNLEIYLKYNNKKLKLLDLPKHNIFFNNGLFDIFNLYSIQMDALNKNKKLEINNIYFKYKLKEHHIDIVTKINGKDSVFLRIFNDKKYLRLAHFYSYETFKNFNELNKFLKNLNIKIDNETIDNFYANNMLLEMLPKPDNLQSC